MNLLASSKVALTRPGRRLRSGFTLIEALVALTLSGLLTASIALALRTGLDASDRARQRGAAHDEARGALEQLTRDLSAAFLSAQNPERTSFHAEDIRNARSGEPFLSLTTLSFHEYREPGAPVEKRSDAVKVEYSLVSDPNRPDASRRLVRKERWLTETGAGITSVICDRVAGLTLRYRSEREARPSWDAEPQRNPPVWAYFGDQPPSRPSTRKLPRAVEVTLLLAPDPRDEGAKPRMYRTVIPVEASGTIPFEPELVPRPNPSGGSGQPNGAPANPTTPSPPGGASL